MAYRAYRLCNRATWIPIVVLILTLASSGAPLATLIIFYNLNSLIDALSSYAFLVLLIAGNEKS
jgi:hypothetical protein